MRCRHQPIIPRLLQRVVKCSQWHAFFSTTRCSVCDLQRVVDRLSVINDWHIVSPPRPLTLQRVVEKKACHWLHYTMHCRRRGIIGWCLQRVVESSTTRCRLHGTSTTAFHMQSHMWSLNCESHITTITPSKHCSYCTILVKCTLWLRLDFFSNLIIIIYSQDQDG